jgi:hypothetical protein
MLSRPLVRSIVKGGVLHSMARPSLKLVVGGGVTVGAAFLVSATRAVATQQFPMQCGLVTVTTQFAARCLDAADASGISAMPC